MEHKAVALILLVSVTLLAGCSTDTSPSNGGDDPDQPATTTGSWNSWETLLSGQEMLFRESGDCPRTTVTYTHGGTISVSSGIWGYSTGGSNTATDAAPWGTFEVGSTNDEEADVRLQCPGA